jgi:hypothetical protein
VVDESSPPPAGPRRPNTVTPMTMLTITSSDLVALSDEQLLEFADKALGIVIPFGTARTKILTKIFNAAVMARDGE